MEAAELIELSLIPFRIKSVPPTGTSFCLMPLASLCLMPLELSELSLILVRIKSAPPTPPGWSVSLIVLLI